MSTNKTASELTEARQRVLAYLERRSLAKGLDIERIHCFDNDTDLLNSDLRIILGISEPHSGDKP